MNMLSLNCKNVGSLLKFICILCCNHVHQGIPYFSILIFFFTPHLSFFSFYFKTLRKEIFYYLGCVNQCWTASKHIFAKNRSFSFIKCKPFILETLFLSDFLGNFVGLKFYSDHFFVKLLDLKISSIFQDRVWWNPQVFF